MPRHGRSSRDSRDGARSARIRSTWHAVKGYNSHRNPRSGNLKHCDRRENCEGMMSGGIYPFRVPAV
ncbi:hypothetical protein JMJ76_0010245 [Colletotrichum scovillei]|nr:hypothetical protein JMJ78_0001703 [Colletotrichum scovillei]KAG7061176.1 hypothetical protein JMJ76_0010245 [Colletotrichum scovillei]